jgi:predicted DNA-binding protein
MCISVRYDKEMIVYLDIRSFIYPWIYIYLGCLHIIGMRKKKCISINEDVDEVLIQLANKLGKEQSTIIEEALKQYFASCNIDTSTASDDIDYDDRLLTLEYKYNISKDDNKQLLQIWEELRRQRKLFINTPYQEKYNELYNRIREEIIRFNSTYKVNTNSNEKNNNNSSTTVFYRCKECKHVKGRKLTVFCTCDCHYGEVDDSYFERVEVEQKV